MLTNGTTTFTSFNGRENIITKTKSLRIKSCSANDSENVHALTANLTFSERKFNMRILNKTKLALVIFIFSVESSGGIRLELLNFFFPIFLIFPIFLVFLVVIGVTVYFVKPSSQILDSSKQCEW